MSEAVDVRGGENAVVTAETGTRNMVSTVRRFFAEPSVQRSIPTAAAALVVFFGLIAYLFLQQPERTTLYASLPENEKARIVDALKNASVDVALDPSSGEVMVPTNDFHRSRILLAAQGLPASMPDGYKQLDDMPMGTSRSVENMRLKHSQEIELARSVSEIDAIVSTRVHLAIPEKSVFVRNNPEPTASVMVQMANGRVLGSQQVDAIVHLVSSSVPGMPKQNVTIIDQNGTLLSQGSADMAGRLSDDQLEYRMRLENIYRTRIVSLVTPIVGAGNVNAQVNLDIDFTRSELTEEKVDPQGNALRSEQLSSDETTERRARGIPGAVANTPPAEAELAQINEQQEEEGGGPSTRSKSTNEVRNYEVSRVISTTQNPSNQIARVFASVLVRDTETLNPETGLMESQPLGQEKLDEIRELVRNAIGIDDERGDNLTVSSAPFVAAVEGERVEWYEQPWFNEVSQQISTILILAIVALGVIRPLLNRILVPVSAGEPGLVVVGEQEDESESVEVSEGESLEDIKAKLRPKKQSISTDLLDTANTYDDKVAVIRLIVGEESGRVSNVFRAMMRSEVSSE
ncbi:MAG TPA: flagellar M-ring protein FliF [Rhodobiaceae bacterium]|jgi:flagellar M-ring protein FliF|nr:flagellar M-ring protein FliF [Rhodobiaceae bacterium]